MDKTLITKISVSVVVAASLIGWGVNYAMTRPPTAEQMMKKADAYEAKGQIAYEIMAYNEIVRTFPENYGVHIKFAEIYKRAGANDNAKVEYVKAMKLNYKNKFAAQLGIADIYVKEKEFGIAESYINQVKSKCNKNCREAVGDFYYQWAEYTKKSSLSDAIRKFKIAFEYYEKAKNIKKLLTTKKEIINSYVKIARTFENAGKFQDAEEILEIALDFMDNSLTHYELAELYRKQNMIDEALSQYKTAFEKNPSVAKTDNYVALLISQAKMYEAKGDKVPAELYYTLAKKYNNKIDVPQNPDNRIIITNFSTGCIENFDSDIIIPQIKFKLKNISKDKISDLKVKVVLSENNDVFNQQIKVISSAGKPLKANNSSEEIVIKSSKEIRFALEKHNFFVQIYISQNTPDNWVLFRNEKFVWDLDTDIIIKH